ncbi:relaxase/mobilization nuclease domain-containing protein [Hominicoprocola fusiformis]
MFFDRRCGTFFVFECFQILSNSLVGHIVFHRLRILFDSGVGITEIALELGRTEPAVYQQIEKLDLYGRKQNPQRQRSGKKPPECLCDRCGNDPALCPLRKQCTAKKENCHLFPGHQVVYALHMDSAHCHLHFVVNSVSFEDGKKHFSGFHDLFPVRDFLQECFPRSNVHIYQSFPDSDVNRFGCSDDDELLRID